MNNTDDVVDIKETDIEVLTNDKLHLLAPRVLLYLMGSSL